MNRHHLKIVIVIIVSLLLAVYVFRHHLFQPVAIVVPHHNLIKNQRQQFLKSVAVRRSRTNTIILLSPDHFSPDQHHLSFSDQTWSLSTGTLSPNLQLIAQLPSNIYLDNNTVSADHGIYNLLPDINNTWPQTKIIPIIIGQNTTTDQLAPLLSFLTANCGSDCLLITSVDFSHYLPAAIADVHDQQSLFVLSSLASNQALNLEVDSPQSIYLLTQFARHHLAYLWNMSSHTNSGKISNLPDTPSTSHIIGWYQPGFNLTKVPHPQTFSFATNSPLAHTIATSSARLKFGVSTLNLDLQESTTINSLTIIPQIASSSSYLSSSANHLQLHIGSDLVVSGFSSNRQTHLVFSPLSPKPETLFLTNSAKHTYLKNLLEPLSSQSTITFDFTTGIVVITD